MLETQKHLIILLFWYVGVLWKCLSLSLLNLTITKCHILIQIWNMQIRCLFVVFVMRILELLFKNIVNDFHIRGIQITIYLSEFSAACATPESFLVFPHKIWKSYSTKYSESSSRGCNDQLTNYYSIGYWV